MEVITKTILKKRLFSQRIKKQMIQDIKSTIEKFKHFKRVDKRFLEAIENEYGHHAYHIKDAYRQEIVIRYQVHSDEYDARPEIRIHKYDGFNESRTLMTWEYMIEQLERYGIDQSIQDYENKIIKYDNEFKLLMNLKEQFSKLQIVNFSEQVYKIRTSLEDLERFAYRD